MVEVSYRREMNHNYMIIRSPLQEAGGYEPRMLAGNCIEGLLKFRIRLGEEKREFYYEITSKQPLRRLLDCRKIAGTEIRKLLLGIAATLNQIEEYLLKEEQILLDPEYIYVEPDSFSVFLCMIPGYSCDFPATFSELLQFLLEKVDHQDPDGLVLAYNLYHESLKENYGMPDLLKQLSQNSEKIFEKRGEEKREPFGGQPVLRDGGPVFRDGQSVLRDSQSTLCDSGPILRNSQPASHDGQPVLRDRGAVLHGGHPGCQNGGPESYEGQPARGRGGAGKERDREKGRYGYEKEEKRGARSSPLAEILIETVKALAAAAAGLAALWFVTGEEGLMRYGLLVGAGSILPLLVKQIFLKERSGKAETRKRTNTDRGREIWEENGGTDLRRAEEETRERESWRMTFGEDEPTCQSDTCESERGTAVETELLADLTRSECLAVLESLSKEREAIEITYVPFIIGKHPDMADYCLRLSTISRLHLRVDKKEGVYIVTDLNSTNGTTVEGYRLQANETVSIKSGDVIYMADAGYRFVERN